jgi:hypothetical protein
MSSISESCRVEQVGERWACIIGSLALMFDSETEAKATRARLIAATIRQRESDRKRGLIQ